MSQFLTSTYLKIFLNYLQIFSILANLELAWDKAISFSFFKISGSVTGSIFQVISFECTRLESDFSIHPLYLIPLLASFMPWVMLVFIMLIWLIIEKVKKKELKLINESFITITLITVFSLETSIINSLVEIINCTHIDRPRYFATNYLDEECWVPKHEMWVFNLFAPGIFFYAVLMPLSLMAYIYYHLERICEEKYFKKVGFLLSGYKTDKFYWYFYFL